MQESITFRNQILSPERPLTNGTEQTLSSENQPNSIPLNVNIGQPQVNSAQTPEEPEEPVPQETVVQTVTFDVSGGWVESIADSPSCVEGKEAKTYTYTNANEVFIVHQNSQPGGCDLIEVPDFNPPLVFTNNAFTIDASASSQCTKEQDPACPIGDGRISIITQPTETESNDQYIVQITDSQLDPGPLEQQVAQLAGLASRLSVN